MADNRPDERVERRRSRAAVGRVRANPASLRRDRPAPPERQERRRLPQVLGRRRSATAAGTTIGRIDDTEEQPELFGTDKLDVYLKEAEQCCGESDAFKESLRRTATYTKDDWLQIKREASENTSALARALEKGEAPNSEMAMKLAEAHRQHFSRWFDECSYDRHVALAELYVADSRYTRHYDELAPGLARYVHDAIHANAARQQWLPASS
jgi:hypothetical protein